MQRKSTRLVREIGEMAIICAVVLAWVWMFLSAFDRIIGR